jgi:D-arabinose 1-dehydrogenase-like Zn-dependent alcohol dehydrogenase
MEWTHTRGPGVVARSTVALGLLIAISRSADENRMIRELGAEEIVRDGANLAKAGGADVILATGNSTAAMEDAIPGLRPDGR